MLSACRAYLNERLGSLTLPAGPVAPYVADDNIFFDELPLDFLKDNSFAACCLPLQDRSKKNGKLIAKARTLGPQPAYSLTRRRFNREILFRCLLYAASSDQLWGTAAGIGLVEQLQQAIAENKLIADSDNSAIRIEPQDLARPWDSGVELDRKLRRPRLAIVRVLFTGGIQTTTALPIATGIELTPVIGPIDNEAIRRDSTGRAMTDEMGEVMTDSRGWNTRGRRKYVMTDSAGDLRRDSTGEIITDSEEK